MVYLKPLSIEATTPSIGAAWVGYPSLPQLVFLERFPVVLYHRYKLRVLQRA